MVSVFSTTTALLSNEFVECFSADKLSSILFKAGKESGIAYIKRKKTFSITGQWKELLWVNESLQNIMAIELQFEYDKYGKLRRKSEIAHDIDEALSLSKAQSEKSVPEPVVYFQDQHILTDALLVGTNLSQDIASSVSRTSNQQERVEIHRSQGDNKKQVETSKEDTVQAIGQCNVDDNYTEMVDEQNVPSEDHCDITDSSIQVSPTNTHNVTGETEEHVVVKTEYFSDEDTEVESNIDYTEILDAAEAKEKEKEIKTEENVGMTEWQIKHDNDSDDSKPASKGNNKSKRKSQPLKYVHSPELEDAKKLNLSKKKKSLPKKLCAPAKAKKENIVKQPKKRRRKKKKKEEEEGHFSCTQTQCEYVGTKNSYLKDHMKRQHREIMHACKDCGKKFGYNKDLRRHERTVHVEPKYFCNNCNKFYKSKRVFDVHILTHKDDYVKPNFVCDVCNKSFSTKYVLGTHVKAEHLGLKKSYLCPTCGRSFTQKNSYRMHANVHAGIKPYVCDVCGKAFTYDKSLKEHKFMHDNIRRFKCNVCSKTFRQTTSLKIHMKVHKDTKDYICVACGKGFTQKQALLRHERIHSGDKPYVCALCLRTFSDYSIIRRHMLLIHKKDPKEWRGDIISNLKKRKDYYIDGGPGHHKRDMTGPTFDEKAKDGDGTSTDELITKHAKQIEEENIVSEPETELPTSESAHVDTIAAATDDNIVQAAATNDNIVQDLSQTQPVFPGTSFSNFSTDMAQSSPAMSDTERSQISNAMPINYSLPQNYSSSVPSSPAPDQISVSEEALVSRYHTMVEAYREMHAQRELYAPAATAAAMSPGTAEHLRSQLAYQTMSPANSESLDGHTAHPQPPSYSYAGYPPYYNPANFQQYPGPQS